MTDELKKLANGCRIKAEIYAKVDDPTIPAAFTWVADEIDRLLGPACRPIDTAPTDGSWVLIHEAFGVNSSKFSRFEVGRYHNGGWWDSKQFTISNPTHWAPLPDEPNHDDQ